MNDWLSQDGDGYLGLDDPAQPDAAPTPPSDPNQQQQQQQQPAQQSDGGWGNDSWGQTSEPQAPEQQQYDTGVGDTQGDWMNNQQQAPAAHDQSQSFGGAPVEQPPAQNQEWSATPAPAQGHAADLSVSAPVLPEVMPQRSQQAAGSAPLSSLVLDVEVQVEVGIGNAALSVEEFLEMGRGSVVELDTPIDAPIDLKVRGNLIARGQLVSINGSYGMRIIEMLNEQ